MNISKSELRAFLSKIEADDQILADFDQVCDFGGRLAGSQGERDAALWLATALGRLDGANLQVLKGLYPVWEKIQVSLTEAQSGEALACTPLLGTASTPPEGLLREVVDLGRGRAEDFARAGDAVAGRIALVRHEYPFTHDHVHRDVKVRMAMQSGADGFLIAYPEPGCGPISGSSGRTHGEGIPSLGISAEAAARLAAKDGSHAKARMVCLGRDIETELSTLVLTLPGDIGQSVVVSAHIDGHPLGESAIDNGTGVAVALALARAVAGLDRAARRTVHVAIFSAEEWDLGGSRRWLQAMTEKERRDIVLDVNLDSVGGDDVLTALTSDFRNLPAFIEAALDDAGLEVGIFEPLKQNSDHANFADVGIPAFRLLAGFERPESSLRYLLTGRDRRDLVTASSLKSAAAIAGAILFSAVHAPAEELASLREKRESATVEL